MLSKIAAPLAFSYFALAAPGVSILVCIRNDLCINSSYRPKRKPVPPLFLILLVRRSPAQQLSRAVPETLPTATSMMELVMEGQILIVSLRNLYIYRLESAFL